MGKESPETTIEAVNNFNQRCKELTEITGISVLEAMVNAKALFTVPAEDKWRFRTKLNDGSPIIDDDHTQTFS